MSYSFSNSDGQYTDVGKAPGYTQFQLAVGAPDAEAKFDQVLKEASMNDANVAKYPVLYAFHGSPLKNWHSVRLFCRVLVPEVEELNVKVQIIRHGLWYKTVAHGRAFGDGEQGFVRLAIT